MSRRRDLELRREVLLERCAQQRVELAQQVAQLRATLPWWPRRALPGDGVVGRSARHPLAWLVLIGGLALFGRTRRMLSFLVLMRSAVSFTTRAAALLRVLADWRASVQARAPAPASETAPPDSPAPGSARSR